MKACTILMLVCFAGATTCRADLMMLSLSTSSGATVAVSDNGIGDLNPLTGVVTYLGAVGANFIVNVTTGLSEPVVSTSTLDLNSVNVGTAADTLTLALTGKNFTEPFPGFELSWGGVLTAPSGSTVSASAWVDNTNTLFGKEIFVGSLGPYGSGAFSGTVSRSVSVAPQYALTQEITIALTGGGTYSGNAQFRHAPEPGTWVLLASGIVLAALSRWRFRKP